MEPASTSGLRCGERKLRERRIRAIGKVSRVDYGRLAWAVCARVGWNGKAGGMVGSEGADHVQLPPIPGLVVPTATPPDRFKGFWRD